MFLINSCCKLFVCGFLFLFFFFQTFSLFLSSDNFETSENKCWFAGDFFPWKPLLFKNFRCLYVANILMLYLFSFSLFFVSDITFIKYILFLTLRRHGNHYNNVWAPMIIKHLFVSDVKTPTERLIIRTKFIRT